LGGKGEEQGTGNREQGSGNREQGTGNRFNWRVALQVGRIAWRVANRGKWPLAGLLFLRQKAREFTAEIFWLLGN
jgi:hypothetical protein